MFYSCVVFKKWVRGYKLTENEHYRNELIYISSNESQWYYEQTVNLRNQENEIIQSEQREFTLEELAEYNGTGGRPAYVAVNGIVYDVSL